MSVRVCVASPAISLPPSKSVLLYFLIFLSVCSPACAFSVFLQLPLTVLLSPLSFSLSYRFSSWPGCSREERRLACSQLLHFAPGSLSCPIQAGHKDRLLGKPILFQIMMPLSRGGHRTGESGTALGPREQSPSFGHCLQAWPFSLNGMLIIYVYIRILNGNSAGLLCLTTD